MGVTPFSPFLAFRTAYSNFLASRTVKQQKQPILAFPFTKKEDKMTVCCMHMYKLQPFLQTLALMFSLFDVLFFNLLQSMFRFIKAEMTPQKVQSMRARKQLKLFDYL